MFLNSMVSILFSACGPSPKLLIQPSPPTIFEAVTGPSVTLLLLASLISCCFTCFLVQKALVTLTLLPVHGLIWLASAEGLFLWLFPMPEMLFLLFLMANSFFLVQVSAQMFPLQSYLLQPSTIKRPLVTLYPSTYLSLSLHLELPGF